MASKIQKSNIIIVVGSFAIDYVTNTSGITHRQNGGPAYWINQTLTKLNMPFSVITGRKPTIVDIRLSRDGEKGKALTIYPIHIRSPRTGKVCIISTIGNEFPIEQWKLLHGALVVDFQGYVRDAQGRGTLVNIPSSIARRIAIAKVTAAELSCLSTPFVKSQKQRILIVTHGAAGFEIFYRGKRYEFTAKGRVSPDAIGAGDTLLTAFAMEWLKTRNITKSALAAQNVVEHFLANKKG